MVCVCKHGNIFAVHVLQSEFLYIHNCCLIIAIWRPSGGHKMHQIRFRPGLRPGPRWGSSRRSPRPPSRLERGTPPPHCRPHRHIRRLDSHLRRSSRRLGRLASSVPPLLFSQFKHWVCALLNALLAWSLTNISRRSSGLTSIELQLATRLP